MAATITARLATLNMTDDLPGVCESICCSAVMDYEDNPATNSANLDNPILPLFKRENFSADLDYTVLEPSLRLASHLLTSNSLVPYILTLMEGDVRDPLGRPCFRPSYEYMESQRGLWSVWPRTGMDEVNARTKGRVARILTDLSDMVTFDLLPSDETYETLLAGCEPMEDPSYVHPSFPFGCKSTIWLSHATYSDLAQLTLEYSSSADPNAPPSLPLLDARFEIALTYTHEVGHAMTFAVSGERPKELCYRDCTVAEAGYELEAQLFGYILDLSKNLVYEAQPDRPTACGRIQSFAVPSMLIAVDWPSLEFVERNEEFSSNIWAGRPLRNYGLATRVPRSFVVDMFNNAFWEAQDQRQDVGPIDVPTIGCFVSWTARYRK